MAKSELHYHGCVQCKRRFGDACGDSTKTFAGPCPSCTSGRLSTLMWGIEPHECCLTAASTANKYDLKIYRLAGKGPWWLCRTCYRQFATDPRSLV